ncbi:hypothetical protein KFU94_70040 [Chloroflexi bacterium TSY]|nr:hypothetical protein [Chloroflexi bacterium TSY]
MLTTTDLRTGNDATHSGGSTWTRFLFNAAFNSLLLPFFAAESHMATVVY